MPPDPASTPASKRPSPPRRRLSRRRRLAFAAVASLLVLGLLEGSGRVVAAATDKERGYDYDEHLGWHMLPNIEKRGEFWSAREPGRTNSLGWRDRERQVAKPPGARRIAVLGDSFTFGQGVDVADRFTDRLERETGVEVLNFGACAFGTDQEVLVYEHEASAFAPDIVLLTVFLGNDLDDIRLEQQSGWSKPYFRLHEDQLELVPPARSWTTALRTHSYLAEFAFQLLDRNSPAARRAPEWLTADTLPLFAALVRRLHRAAADRDARLLVMLAHPCDANRRPYRHPRTADVLSALADAGIATLDTFDEFAAHAGDGFYLENMHWSPDGHAVAADLLVDELRERGWLAR